MSRCVSASRNARLFFHAVLQLIFFTSTTQATATKSLRRVSVTALSAPPLGFECVDENNAAFADCGRSLGGYGSENNIGKGGFGEVFRGKAKSSFVTGDGMVLEAGDIVAMKKIIIPPPCGDPETPDEQAKKGGCWTPSMRAMHEISFQRELKFMRLLSECPSGVGTAQLFQPRPGHGNIGVASFKGVQTGGKERDWLVLPLLDGNLDKYTGQLPPATAWAFDIKWDIMKQLLCALLCLRKHRVSHNDIKPDNIMYRGGTWPPSEGGKVPEIAFVDFGMSSRLIVESTAGGTAPPLGAPFGAECMVFDDFVRDQLLAAAPAGAPRETAGALQPGGGTSQPLPRSNSDYFGVEGGCGWPGGTAMMTPPEGNQRNAVYAFESDVFALAATLHRKRMVPSAKTVSKGSSGVRFKKYKPFKPDQDTDGYQDDAFGGPSETRLRALMILLSPDGADPDREHGGSREHTRLDVVKAAARWPTTVFARCDNAAMLGEDEYSPDAARGVAASVFFQNVEGEASLLGDSPFAPTRCLEGPTAFSRFCKGDHVTVACGGLPVDVWRSTAKTLRWGQPLGRLFEARAARALDEGECRRGCPEGSACGWLGAVITGVDVDGGRAVVDVRTGEAGQTRLLGSVERSRLRPLANGSLAGRVLWATEILDAAS
jgi:serine/threonine protein kinase